MRSYHHLLMAVLRGRDHIDRRLAELLPWHTDFILLDVFLPALTDEENVIRLRDAASAAPRHVQRVMVVGPTHGMLLLAAVPATARRAIDYAAVLAGDRNHVISRSGEARDRHGVAIPGSTLDSDALDLWAEQLGIALHAEGLYERKPSFLAYARALGLP